MSSKKSLVGLSHSNQQMVWLNMTILFSYFDGLYDKICLYPILNRAVIHLLLYKCVYFILYIMFYHVQRIETLCLLRFINIFIFIIYYYYYYDNIACIQYSTEQ